MTDMTLGKYRILAEIGKGGFATVYRALDTTLDREVALKVLDPILARDPVWAARFQREAKAVARLRHPHIVTIHEVGKGEDRLYIAMDLIEGPSLAERIAESGRLPWEEALALLGQVADALDYAHGQGVLHRDLKPGNILLDPKRGAILTDFGFARLVGESSMSVSMSSTAGGNLVGTPAYIAPEVWDGEEPAAQTDIYSLGGVAYEMLTGEVLFAGKTPSVVIKKHTVDGPSFPDAGHWPAGVPNGVREVLARALAKDPAERYANAGALTDALSALGQPMPVTNITPPGTPLHGNAPTPAPARVPMPEGARSRPRWLWPMAGAGGVALIVVLALVIKAVIGDDQTPPGAISPTAVPIAAATAMTPATPSLVVQAPATSSTASPLTATAVQPTLTSVPPSVTPQSPTPPPGIGATVLSDKDGMTLVYVPAGEFMMGAAANDSAASPDEKPQHPIALDAFWIDRTEVTNAQYRKCVKAGACQRPESGDSYYENPTLSDYPVLNTSWYDADAYCQWAQRRLPTEAEWEKAARGIDGRTYPWGNAPVASDKVNFCDQRCSYTWKSKLIDDGYALTSPAGHFVGRASPYGALDMAGNVWEWVADWYDAKYYGHSPAENPLGPGSGTEKVLRGGSWYDYAGHVRTTRRIKDDPISFDSNTGFRCAHSADTDPIVNPSLTPAGSGPATTSGMSVATAIPAASNVLTLTLAPGVLLELIRVPGGEFLMGSDKVADPLALDAELPQHSVSQEGYWIGKYEVTVAQFAAFVRATRYETTAERLGSGWTWIDRKWQEVAGADWAHPSGPGSNIEGKENHPVTLVSWDDAVAFCRWATEATGRTLRLPSEAEWEKAARGTDGRIYPWGNTPPNAQRTNYDNVNGTTPVGQYPLGVSPNGALDMAGNAWEWTSSLYRGYPYGREDGREAQGDRGTHVLRGGSFLNESQNVRSAVRLTYFPDDRYANFGFRVASAGF